VSERRLRPEGNTQKGGGHRPHARQTRQPHPHGFSFQVVSVNGELICLPLVGGSRQSAAKSTCASSGCRTSARAVGVSPPLRRPPRGLDEGPSRGWCVGGERPAAAPVRRRQVVRPSRSASRSDQERLGSRPQGGGRGFQRRSTWSPRGVVAAQSGGDELLLSGAGTAAPHEVGIAHVPAIMRPQPPTAPGE
jgi:hypothetical protein